MLSEHQYPSQSHEQTERARGSRRDSTVPESLLWHLLRDRNLFGVKFRRQVPIGCYTVDFYCHATSTVVEVDGMSHLGRGEADEARTAFLASRGLRVLRVANDDVLADRYLVAEWIAREMGLDDRAIRSKEKSPHPGPFPKGEGAGGKSPHPNPLPKGEGVRKVGR